MFNLKSKNRLFKRIFIINFLKSFFGIASATILFLLFIILLEHDIKNIFVNFLLITLLIAFSLFLLSSIQLIIYRKRAFYETFYEIHNMVKSLDEQKSQLPKVVFLYTTHNDFIGSRLLQSAKQIYQNVEYWISDGSTKQEKIQEVEQFAKDHQFNLYRMDERGSQTKAHNINSFLSFYQKDFDYLLVMDADSVIHPEFIKSSIAIFLNSNNKRIGYVSALNRSYHLGNKFSRYCSIDDTNYLFQVDGIKTFTKSSYSNLYSASVLINKTMIDEFKNIPNSCLEDWYLEKRAEKNYWTGIINPVAICFQGADRTFADHIKRTMRVYDWMVRYHKNYQFPFFNHKYKKTLASQIGTLFSGFSFILSPILIAFSLWLFISFFDKFLENKLLFISIISMLFLGFFNIFFKLYMLKIVLTKKEMMWLLLKPFFLMAKMPFIIKHWFNSLFLKKYSSFVQVNRFASNSSSYWAKNRLYIAWLVILVLINITINFVFIHFNLFNQWQFFIYMLIVVCLSLWIVSIFSILIMNLLSNIKTKENFSFNNFVEYKTNAFEFNKCAKRNIGEVI